MPGQEERSRSPHCGGNCDYTRPVLTRSAQFWPRFMRKDRYATVLSRKSIRNPNWPGRSSEPRWPPLPARFVGSRGHEKAPPSGDAPGVGADRIFVASCVSPEEPRQDRIVRSRTVSTGSVWAISDHAEGLRRTIHMLSLRNQPSEKPQRATSKPQAFARRPSVAGLK